MDADKSRWDAVIRESVDIFAKSRIGECAMKSCTLLATFLLLTFTGCNPVVNASAAISVPTSATVPNNQLTQVLSQAESIEFKFSARLKSTPKPLVLNANNQDIRLKVDNNSTLVGQIRIFEIENKADSSRSTLAWKVDKSSDLSFSDGVKVIVRSAEFQISTIKPGDEEFHFKANVSEFLRAATSYLFMQAPEAEDASSASNLSDAFDPTQLIHDITVKELNIKLKPQSLIRVDETRSLRIDHAVATATGEFDIKANRFSNAALKITAGKASLIEAGKSIDFANVNFSAGFDNLRADKLNGELTTTIPGATIQQLVRHAFDPKKIAGNLPIAIDAVDTSAANATFSLSLSERTAKLTIGQIRMHTRGRSHKGHGLDLIATAQPMAFELPLDGSAASSKIDFNVKSRVRTCVGQFTGKKKVLFAKVTIVKPIVIEPFDASLTLNLTAQLNGKQVVITIVDTTDARGALRVGAIGDGPNAWATISPPDATHTTMTVNYVGVNKRVENPLRKIIHSLKGKVLNLILE